MVDNQRKYQVIERADIIFILYAIKVSGLQCLFIVTGIFNNCLTQQYVLLLFIVKWWTINWNQTQFKTLRCCYTAQFSQQLVSQHHCNESCRKNHSPVTLCNFLHSATCNILGRGKLGARIKMAPQSNIRKCTCSASECDSKIAAKVAGGVKHCAMALKVAAMHCKK